jgi:hypothetical protein
MFDGDVNNGALCSSLFLITVHYVQVYIFVQVGPNRLFIISHHVDIKRERERERERESMNMRTLFQKRIQITICVRRLRQQVRNIINSNRFKG